MRKFQFLTSLVILASILLSACGATAPATEVMMSKPTAAMMSNPTMTPGTMMSKVTAMPGVMMNETATPDAMMGASTPGAMMETPAWYGVSLTDVSSGKTFKVDDYKGKVILVETMAVWCTNCKQQQDNIKAFHTQLGMKDDFVTVSLDIDPHENLDTLKTYVAKTGFDWLYAVSPVDATREIAKLYGDQFLNPTSTPILIIDRKGIAHPLPFGIKSADDLSKAVDMYLKEGM
jgi:cytochrome oxidase Cu insertion factor (SCO1/SenC/PrrC family)